MLRISALGGLSVTVSGRPIPNAVTAKALALLIYLVITGRPQRREALQALLWSDMGETEAQNNLRQSLYQLKKHADAWLDVGRTEAAFVPTQPHWVDVLALEHGEGPDDLVGEFLQGFSVQNAQGFEEWVAGQRSRFGEAASLILMNRATAAEKARNLPAALAALNQLLLRDPWREEAHRAKMLLLAHSGQHSAALAQYAACEASLRQELSVAPAPATAKLAERIARAQLLAPTRWPNDGGRFVGREQELTDLVQRFQSGDARLITLLGPGGMGKTRLALEVAQQLAPAFLEGAYHVPLQPLSTPRDVLPAIAAAVGLAAPRNPLAALSDYFRDKDALLLLDNAEHVLDAADGLGALLRSAPGLRMLVTSREVLHLSEEHVYAIAGLSLAAREQPADAAQLFITRGRALLRNYAPDAAECADIDRLCRLVDGVPLALELASGMLTSHTARAIGDRLDHDQGALVSQLRNAPDRHRSLRAIYDQSWAALNPAEREAALRLSVFRGGFDNAAALAVADVAGPLLGALADKSFVRHDGSADGTMRYSMHGVLRAFGAEALACDGEANGLRTRHSGYYSEQLAARYDIMVRTDQVRILRMLQHDDANLAQAWEHATAQRDTATLQRMLPALFRYVNVLCKASQWLPRMEAAHAALCAEDNMFCQMLVTRIAGLLNFLGDYARARAFLEPALQVFIRQSQIDEADFAHLILGNGLLAQGSMTDAEPHYLAVLGAQDEFIAQAALANLGIIDTRKGEYGGALARLEASRAANKRIGNLRGEAIQALNMGDALYRQRELERSAVMVREAASLFAQVQDPIGNAIAAGNLGELLQEMGQLDAAADQFATVLRQCRDLGMLFMVTSMLGSIAHVRFTQGRLDEVEAPLRECLALAHKIEAFDQIAIHTQTGVRLALARRDLTAARAALDVALQAALKTQETEKQTQCLVLLAEWLQASRQDARAGTVAADLLALPNLPSDLAARLHALGHRTPAATAMPFDEMCRQGLAYLTPV